MNASYYVDDDVPIQVTAPSDLPAGYVFESVTDEGQQISVTVPEGGVQAGDIIVVRAEDLGATDAMETASSSSPPQYWRKSVFACLETIFTLRFWIGCLTPWVLLGQVMQRQQLNPCGCPSRTSFSKYTCIVYATSLTILVIVLLVTPSAVLGPITLSSLILWHFVAGTCVRFQIRRANSIHGTCCTDTCLDDCCCACWCHTCTVIQLSRQSHDETVYPYTTCSTNGLPPESA